MVLNGVKLIGSNGVFNIEIDGTQINAVSKNTIAAQHNTQLYFDNALAFPGLINSHDHLDFNLFPQLGHKVYSNYVEWGNYIHAYYKQSINAVLNVPVDLRARWGIYKNLMCGVTTVHHHGDTLSIADPLITIANYGQSLHSYRLESSLKLKLNNPLMQKTSAVIHVGEGTDELASEEIDKLIKWNILSRAIIGVHGVAMTERQAAHFKALVWCPQTNYFLLNKTAPINKLKTRVPILFGTDSTLTGNWDIWDHIRMARKTLLLTDDELYASLTTTPAAIWKLNSGKIASGKNADIVIVKQQGNDLISLFAVKPEDILMVIHQGKVRLFDEEIVDQLDAAQLSGFSKIYVNHSSKYVQGDLPGLMNEIHQYYPKMDFPVQADQYAVVN